MKKLLPLLPRPSRYVGGEWGTVLKDPATVRARVALCFPDLYEVGMSYLGLKILLQAVNGHDDLWAERAFTPCQEAAALLREHKEPLATMESDTPLASMDALAFSLTHELCYTNVLYMLDLAGIPLKSADRDESHPLVMAGGGACFNAEPLAEFVDVMVLGDGEEALPNVLHKIAEGREAGLNRPELLRSLIELPGVYVPSFFEFQGAGKPLKPLVEGYESVEKAVLHDLDDFDFPTNQMVSFGAVHDRLTVEIARGCTRGCRFCQAGIIYRPVRERNLDNLAGIIERGLNETGYEETSFLSLSTGDFSALDELFSKSFDKCAAEQVSISLPSLRVGSLSGPIMERISSIRRTGATLAPEAGSQRMRDVINKGVTEEGLLEHVRKLFDNGWQSIKLYFMIGLPTETREDLDAILDLCLKVRDVAGRHIKRLQVSAAVSPFVPKPQTPFQWDRQISLDEIRDSINYLRDIFYPHKRVRLKFHQPEMSFLEGIFSRGDRRLGPVVQDAYDKGALFSSWKDHLKLEPYLEAMEAHGLTPEEYQAARDEDAPLPWDHLTAGVTKKFLLTERGRAMRQAITEDCRFNACRNCGVCGHDDHVSILRQSEERTVRPRVLKAERDQSETAPLPDLEVTGLDDKAMHVRIWYTKLGPAAYLSQLELQSVFERAMRRSAMPVSFSAGFHPMPRISFAKALPVGVESSAEYINLMLREELSHADIRERLDSAMPEGLRILSVEPLSMSRKQTQADTEIFLLTYATDNVEERKQQWRDFLNAKTFEFETTTKKGKPKIVDLRPFVREVEDRDDNAVAVTFSWKEGYINPLTLIRTVNPDLGQLDVALFKERQMFPKS